MSSSSIGDVEYYQQSAQTSVTAFLAKLWALVNDTTCDDLIAWDASGNSFHVYDQSRFAREILPRYFKHNNFASFIRQLNMYGFRKISTIEHGSLKAERDDIEFAHQYFIRGHDGLLEQIKRRAPDHQHKINIQPNKTEPIPAPTTSPAPVPPVVSSSAVSSTTVYTDSKGSTRPVEFSQVLDDVRNLHAKQTSLTDKLFHMQDENQALWREVGMLKQKHAKQQQIVSKLMEFLLHFLTSSTQSHRPSVEQPSPRQSQQEQTEHHTITSQPIPAHSLKRKPAALMLSDEPKKRTTMQQHQHLLSQPITIIGRPQGITINELTENDPSSWLHTTDTSPLVDLVPSPPPTQTLDDTYPHQQPPPLQQPPNNYEWSVSGDELRNSLNKTLKTLGNGAGDDSTYIPDFFLTSDLPNGAGKSAIDPIDPTNLAGINTSSSDTLPILKEERIEFPSSFHSHASEPIVLNPSIYPNTKREKVMLNSNTPFSLDDITGDVDHIQSSLDNIRELMFDHLPDNPTIEDLFCDDPALLSPLLTNNGQTTNILAEPGTEPRSMADVNSFIYPVANATNNLSPCKQIILHKSEMPVVNAPADVSNQLLEQLMHETAKVDEHRQAISQLNREKLNLDGHLAPLEQQFNGRNQP